MATCVTHVQWCLYPEPSEESGEWCKRHIGGACVQTLGGGVTQRADRKRGSLQYVDYKSSDSSRRQLVVYACH